MVNENLINLVNNNKPVEEVREIPTYQPKYTYEEATRLKEQFIAEQKEAIKKYQIKGSPLSPEARSKVIRKWGSDYVSENRDFYGPGNDQSKAAAKEIGGVALTTLTIICPPAGFAVGSGVAAAGAITAAVGVADKDAECVKDGLDILAMGAGSAYSGASGLKSHKGSFCLLPICPKK